MSRAIRTRALDRTDDGPHDEKRVMGLLEREGYEVAVYAYREGTVFDEHAHAQDKCDAVIEGVLPDSRREATLRHEAGRPALRPGGHAPRRRGRRPAAPSCRLDGTRW